MKINVAVPGSVYELFKSLMIPVKGENQMEQEIPLLVFLGDNTPVQFSPNDNLHQSTRGKLSGFGGRKPIRVVSISCFVFEKLARLAEVNGIQALLELTQQMMAPVLGLPIRFDCSMDMAMVNKKGSQSEDIFFPVEDAVEAKVITLTAIDRSGVDMTSPAPKTMIPDVYGNANSSMKIPATYPDVKISFRLDMEVIAIDEFGIGKPAVAVPHTETHQMTVV